MSLWINPNNLYDKDDEASRYYGGSDCWKYYRGKGGYLKPVAEQAALLAERFSGLDISHVDELMWRYKRDGKFFKPDGMNGFGVIPKNSAIARLSAASTDKAWPAYNRALSHLFAVMKQARPDLEGYEEGYLGPTYERLIARTRDFYRRLESVPGDVLILAVQTGFYHKCRSIQYVRRLIRSHEFGLDSFAVGCILLTHPERLRHFDHPRIDCPGSERCSRSSPGLVYSLASCWYFQKDKLRFGACLVRPAGTKYAGSASAVRL